MGSSVFTQLVETSVDKNLNMEKYYDNLLNKGLSHVMAGKRNNDPDETYNKALEMLYKQTGQNEVKEDLEITMNKINELVKASAKDFMLQM